MFTYDVTVIGGGPAGYVGAIRAAQLGLRTALVEKEKIGGTCLNWGCMPTKTLYTSAEWFSKLRHASHYGIRLGKVELDFGRVMERKEEVIGQLAGGIRQLLKANGVDVYFGKAKVLDRERIRVNGIEWKTRHILLATGSRSAAIPVPGADLQGVYDSRSILGIDTLPETLVIIGGGVIGIEFASIFAAFGTRVTVIEMSGALLTGVDDEIARRMTALLKQKGVEVRASNRVLDIRAQPGGGLRNTGSLPGAGGLVVNIANASGVEDYIETGHVLVAVGRVPDFGNIDLERLGVDYHPRTGIVVNERMQTSVETIYAAGDVTGGTMLAHAASHESIAAMEHIASAISPSPADRQLSPQPGNFVIPACIFSLPEIAMAGMTETEARAVLEPCGDRVAVARFPFAASGRAQSAGETEGFVKLVARQSDGVLLGVHILGAHASELIAEAMFAIRHGLTAESLAGTIHPHPTLSESVAEAALGIHGQMLHMFKARS